MRNVMLLSALFLGGCSFTVHWPTNSQPYDDSLMKDADDVLEEGDFFAASDSINHDWQDWSVESEKSTTSDKVELVDAQECAENEYQEEHFNKCAFYPCCEIKGNWTFVFNDMSTFPWKPISYSATIIQNNAYIEMKLTSAGAPKDLPLPKTISGLLEKTVLHMDGENTNGFLTLDATNVKKQLESDTLAGNYVWLQNNGQMVGTFYLQRP